MGVSAPSGSGSIATESSLHAEFLLSIGFLLIYNRRMSGSEKPYLNFICPPELLKRLDDFRYQNRFPTRAAAIKWLLEAALSADLKPEKYET